VGGRAAANPVEDDWIHCTALAELPGFSVPFSWSVTASQLRSLREDLGRLDRNFPSVENVPFRPYDPNIELQFGLTRGEYVLRPNLTDGPTISGRFSFDQSYIPTFVRTIDAFLAETGHAST